MQKQSESLQSKCAVREKACQVEQHTGVIHAGSQSGLKGIVVAGCGFPLSPWSANLEQQQNRGGAEKAKMKEDQA